MEYVEVTVGVGWIAIGVLMGYVAVINRNPMSIKLGAARRLPMAMAGAGGWLVRSSVRPGLRGSKRANASR